jgi:peptide/nickel transport system substrate-binding protein
MHRRALVVSIVAIGLVAAACGGGKSASKTTNTTAAAEESTTTTSSASSSTEATTSSSTAVPAAGGGASTTVKPTATTVKSGSTKQTTPKGISRISGGITNATAPPSTAPDKNIQPGGTLTYLKAGEIAGFDPVILQNSGSFDGPIAAAVFDMLVYTDPTTGGVVPQTAESLSSTDALVWTLKLHPNIKFTDGTPYDAAAVKFNWLRLQDPKNAAAKAAQANLISSMDVIDPVTLKITLKAKNAEFPIAVALIPFIGSPAAIQSKGDGFTSDPVGAGPFTLKNWVRNSQMTFVRNPNYWNAPLPYLDQIIMKPIIDESQRINTFQAGGGNLVFVGAPSNADALDKAKAGVDLPMILNGGITLYFNTRKPPFNDVRLRQAIAMAIDPNDYSKVVDNGLVEPIDSIFRHDSPFYDPSILQPAYNPTQAQALINQVAQANGGPIKFTMTTLTSQNYTLSAQYVQAVVNKLDNIHMNLLGEATALHVTNCNTSAFDAICATGIIFDDPEPAWTGLFLCGVSPNPSGYCNSKFDADVADNQATLDPNKRIADIKDAQKIYYADLPALTVERRYSWSFAAPNLQGFKYANDGLPLVDRMWLKTH